MKQQKESSYIVGVFDLMVCKLIRLGEVDDYHLKISFTHNGELIAEIDWKPKNDPKHSILGTIITLEDDWTKEDLHKLYNTQKDTISSMIFGFDDRKMNLIVSSISTEGEVFYNLYFFRLNKNNRLKFKKSLAKGLRELFNINEKLALEDKVGE